MAINLKKTIYFGAAILGALTAGAGLSASATHANASQVQTRRVVAGSYTHKPNKAVSNDEASYPLRRFSSSIQAKYEQQSHAHLDYYGNGTKGHVVPNPGRSDSTATGFGKPTVSKHYRNYLNGRYNIWSKPGRYNKKGRYVPSGVRIISMGGARKLALKQVPFKGLRLNKRQIMEVGSRNWVGWIPAKGLYSYSRREGRLPVYTPKTHIMKAMPAPRSWKQMKHPKFRKGSRVIVLANHMKGMYGAKGRVAAAYNTRLYMVNYRSTVNHKLVRNHKWVVTKEIKPYKKGRLHVGETVRLLANHMKGMYGAKAVITAIHHAPAYMINYRPTNNYNTSVVNHRWVTQDELAK